MTLRVLGTGLSSDLGRALAHDDTSAPDTLQLLSLSSLPGAIEPTGAADAAVHVVLHLGGARSSTRRLDEALREDIDDTRACIEVARAHGVPLVLVSRLSVVAPRGGLVVEEDPRQQPFGGSTLPGAQLDVQREIESLHKAARDVADVVDAADQQALRHAQLQREMNERGGPTSGRAFEAALRARRDDAHAAAQRRALVERAASWRFLTASVDGARAYTRALAELLVASSGVPCTILRVPALLQQGDVAVDDPALSRVFARVHDGVLRLPFAPRARIEALPVPLVAQAVRLALHAASQPGSALAVAHVATGDRAPLSAERFVELLDLHLRRTRQHDDGATPALSRALSVDAASSLPAAITAPAALAVQAASSLSALVPSSLAPPALRPLVQEARTTLHGLVRPDGADVALCRAPPFFADDVRFSRRGLRALAARASCPMPDVDAIDWRAVMLEQHLPALQRRHVDMQARKAQHAVPAYDSLAHLLVESAARFGDRPALSLFIAPGADGSAPEAGSDVVDVSYRELLARARAAALRLHKAGVQPGDRVVVAGANHPAWSIVAFGALLLRATLVPLDVNLEPDACSNVVRKARPRVAVVDRSVRARLESVLPEPLLDLQLTATTGPGLAVDHPLPSPDDLASILFTSGTTGEPKGVMLTHANFCALLGSLLAIFPVGDDDRLLSVLPLHHTFEFSCGLLMPLAAGARIYTPDALTGERVLYALKAGRITALVGVPALWQLLERRVRSQVKERGDVVETVFSTLLSLNTSIGARFGISAGRVLLKPVHDQLGGHLRILISGGSALPPAVHALFQGLGLPLAEGYGLTESAPVLTVAEGVPGAPAGTVGRPIPGVDVKIHEPDEHGVGEVWARGGNVMRGYFENAAATDDVLHDGWLKTGDLGRIDDEGRLHLVGRSKDVVISASGENIYLDDVEKRLEDIPGIAELTLLGLPDPRGGERLALVAVPTAPVTDDDAWGRARQLVGARVLKLPAFARPALIELVEGPLPRTSTRKVKRKDVRARLQAVLAQRADQERAIETAGVIALSPVRAAIAQAAGVDVGKLQPHTSLPQDLGFDSLMWVELSTLIEAACGTKPDAEQLVTKETVAELEQFVAGLSSSSSESSTGARTADRSREGASPSSSSSSSRSVPAFVWTPARAALALGQRSLYEHYFTTTVHGRAFIPHNRPTIVVANHTSHLDMGLVKYALGAYGAGLRPLAARDYFFEGNRFKVAFFEHLTNLVPIDRETGSGLAFEQARSVVQAGHVVLIFPEGTRREDGTLGTFKPLVAKLALVTGVDVLPLHLTGCYELFPRDALAPSRGALHARIGAPLPSSELARLTSHLPAVQAARASASIIQRSVVALSQGRVLELHRATSLDALDGATRTIPVDDARSASA